MTFVVKFVRFVLTLVAIILFVAIVLRDVRDTAPPPPQRYELRMMENGSMFVFDTATGMVRQVRKGDLQEPKVQPEPNPAVKKF